VVAAAPKAVVSAAPVQAKAVVVAVAPAPVAAPAAI